MAHCAHAAQPHGHYAPAHFPSDTALHHHLRVMLTRYFGLIEFVQVCTAKGGSGGTQPFEPGAKRTAAAIAPIAIAAAG